MYAGILMLTISTIYLCITLYVIITGKYCMCGKSKPAIFLFAVHPRLHLLIVEALLSTLCCALNAVANDPPPSPISFFTGLWVVFAILDWLAVWYHEKDKLKKAAKALGRVKVLSNGRLGVVKA
jgi:hypothetical protein